jgi:hypothetical protein
MEVGSSIGYQAFRVPPRRATASVANTAEIRVARSSISATSKSGGFKATELIRLNEEMSDACALLVGGSEMRRLLTPDRLQALHELAV